MDALIEASSWLNAGWDPDLLKIELDGLRALDFDMGLTGFSLDEITALTAERALGLTDPDEAAAVPAVPVSEPGDVWILGKHRLVCGDSTTAEAVDKALKGVKPHLMVTDPPYGVAYDANWRNVADHVTRKERPRSAPISTVVVCNLPTAPAPIARLPIGFLRLPLSPIAPRLRPAVAPARAMMPLAGPD